MIKQDLALASLFVKEFRTAYKKTTGKEVSLNLYTEKWAAKDIIESYGYDECMIGMKWYFKVARVYDWKIFIKNVGAYIDAANSATKDRQDRKSANERANAWRDR